MTEERIVRSVLMSAALAVGVVGCPPGPPDDGDAGVGGSGAIGTGGSATGGAAVGEPLPGAAQFTKLALTNGAAAAGGSRCVDGDPSTTFTVTAATAELRWDGCEPPFGRVADCRTLDTAESSSVRTALDQVRLGASGVCVAGAQGSTLDLSTPVGTGQYASDDLSCQPPPAGRKFVTGLNVLGSELASLAAPVRLTSSFTRLTFGWSGGMPEMGDPTDACQSADYDNQITVAADTRTLSWNYCRGGDVVEDSRPLVEPEWKLILDGLSQVQVGWRCGASGADASVLTLDLELAGTVERYVDDFYAINPPPAGRAFVMHLRDLSGTDETRLASLLPSLTRYTSLPAVDRLTLWYGFVPAGDQCGAYGGTYGFDNASGALSWEECTTNSLGAYGVVRRGSRTVTENERTLILVSLAQLVPGTYAQCDPDPPTAVAVAAAGSTTRYVSARWGGCDPLPEGTFIRNLEEMEVLRTLAQKT